MNGAKKLLGATLSRKQKLNSSNGSFFGDCDLFAFIPVTIQGLVAFQAVVQKKGEGAIK